MNTKKTFADDLKIGDIFLDYFSEQLREITDISQKYSPYGPGSIAVTSKKVDDDTPEGFLPFTKTRFERIDSIYEVVV